MVEDSLFLFFSSRGKEKGKKEGDTASKDCSAKICLCIDIVR